MMLLNSGKRTLVSGKKFMLIFWCVDIVLKSNESDHYNIHNSVGITTPAKVVMGYISLIFPQRVVETTRFLTCSSGIDVFVACQNEKRGIDLLNCVSRLTRKVRFGNTFCFENFL